MEEVNEFRIPIEPSDWITKSRIQSFRFCKRQYLYFAVVQIPFTASHIMISGRKFHYFSSRFYRLVDVKEKPTFKYYRSLLPNDPDVNKLYDNFATFEVQRMESLLTQKLDPAIFFLPIVNEVSVKVTDQQMSGHVDRVWLMKDVQKLDAVIMEIKSGGIASKTSLRREGCFYQYLISQTELKEYIGVIPSYIGVYSPRNNEYWFEKVSKRSMNALFETLDELVYLQLKWAKESKINEKLINNEPLTEEETKIFDEIWPKNEYADCTMCPYERQCWL